VNRGAPTIGARRSGLLTLVILILGAEAPQCGAAQPSHPSSRVSALLAQLTQDEKLGLTQGGKDPSYLGQAGYIAGVPRLAIPSLRFADGPVGVLNGYETTALPQAIALAATFDPVLARQYGVVLGREARATNMDVVLGPMVNIARIPNWGRNITSFGEDPFLTSEMVKPEIEGIQAQGVMATTKHFVANNQSDNAGGGLNNLPGFDFIVDQRTLHEIYLPAFEAAVKAGTASMMAAYNHINGPWNAHSAPTLTGILREQWGWTGFVMSDWHANHASGSIEAGLDLEMPGIGPVQLIGREEPYWGAKLKAEIQAGKVRQGALDQAVGRILTQMEIFGFLDGTRVAAPLGVDVEQDAAVARKIATDGAVLLKNDGILPLSDTNASRIALIGPTAGQIAVGPGAGRSEGVASRLISPLDALKHTWGAPVAYAVGDDLTGVAIPTEAFRTSAGAPGLTRTPCDGASNTTDAAVDFTGAKALPAGRCYRWTGSLQVPTTGEYLLATQSWGGSTGLLLSGQLQATSARLAFGNGVPRRLSSLLPTTDGLDNGQVIVKLEAGKSYPIELDAQAESYSLLQVRLAWITPQMRQSNRAAAASAAKAAAIAVVFVWARGGEGFDSSQNLSLPNDQDALIDAVVAANPNTIVVLNTGDPVAMPWRNKVRAILEMWFPGQEGGWATADLLSGRANPAGRLPISFPQRGTDTPALAPGHPERSSGVDQKIIYSEGIFVGYRHYDESRIKAMFPFGFGLSYTKFDYSKLHVSAVPGGAQLSFTVRNVGPKRGIETPQVYVGRPRTAPVAMARKVLAGFQRLELDPLEAKTVTMRIDARQMSYWSVDRHAWATPPGARAIYVASGVDDVKLTGSLDMKNP
jgi:beta-glucosidase